MHFLQRAVGRAAHAGFYLQLVRHDDGGQGIVVQAVAIVRYDAVYTVLLHCVLQPLVFLLYSSQNAGQLRQQARLRVLVPAAVGDVVARQVNNIYSAKGFFYK